jgi:transketolase
MALSELGLVVMNRDSEGYLVTISELGKLVLELLDPRYLRASILHTRALRLRKLLMKILSHINDKHFESSVSCLNILLVIFDRILSKLESSDDDSRDMVILSKGHAAPALYIVMKEYGLIELNLEDIGKVDSPLQTHVTAYDKFIPVSTGSLGQGLSVANGIALALKMDGSSNNVYVILGDGEVDEGQIWEAAMTSSTYGLDNIIGVIDRNNVQLNGYTEDIKKKEPLAMKWEAFGWHVTELETSHPYHLYTAFDELENVKGKPKMVIVRTVDEIER